MKDVVLVSKWIQRFCLARGISERGALLAGLSMEEMAGNVVEHGFTKDRKPHSVDLRVVPKEEEVLLRINDDCVPFDPHERLAMVSGDEPTKNIGLRIAFRAAKDVQYQNILGLNVLTIRIGK